MTWHGLLTFVRLLIIAAIFTSIGLVAANMWRVRGRVSPPLRGYLVALSISYALYALVAVLEVELRFNRSWTWRTPAVLLAAAVGLGVQVWALVKWKKAPP